MIDRLVEYGRKFIVCVRPGQCGKEKASAFFEIERFVRYIHAMGTILGARLWSKNVGKAVSISLS